MARLLHVNLMFWTYNLWENIPWQIFLFIARTGTLPWLFRGTPRALNYDEESGKVVLRPEVLSALKLSPRQLKDFDALISRLSEAVLRQAKERVTALPRYHSQPQWDRFLIPADLELFRSLRTELLAKSIEIAGEEKGRMAARQLVAAANTDPFLRGFVLLDAEVDFETLDFDTRRPNIRRHFALRYNGETVFDVTGTAYGFGIFSPVFDLGEDLRYRRPALGLLSE